MASVRKRGPRQGETRIRRQGEPVQCRIFETKGRAERWPRQIEGEMDQGICMFRTEAGGTTLTETLKRYKTEVSANKKETIRRGIRVRHDPDGKDGKRKHSALHSCVLSNR